MRYCSVLFVFGILLNFLSGCNSEYLVDGVLISPREQSLSLIADQTKGQVEFDIVNNTDTTVEILSLKASCGCLTPKIDIKKIAPGAKAVLTVDWSGSPKTDGRQRVIIKTNEPENNVYIATVDIHPMVGVKLSNSLFQLGNISEGQKKRAKTTLLVQDLSFEIVSIESSSEFVMASVIETNILQGDPRFSKELVIEVSVLGSGPLGPLVATLDLISNSVDDAEFTLNVHIETIHDIEFTYSQISIPSPHRGKKFSIPLQVSSRSGTPFRIQARKLALAPLENPGISVRPASYISQEDHEVVFSGRTPSEAGSFKTEILFDIEYPTSVDGTKANQADIIALPVVGYVRH